MLQITKILTPSQVAALASTELPDVGSLSLVAGSEEA